jgi:broad specificity polyphosphatase/5'/3'-nucleotidase SurE
MGCPIFWFTVKRLEDEAEGTDRWAFANRWMSITPLRLDLTAEKDLARALSLAQVQEMTTARQHKAKARTRKKLQKRRLGAE